MNDNEYVVKGEAVSADTYAFKFSKNSSLILTIHPDGRLEFAPHAHPREAVEILLDLWRQYVPPCECRKARKAE